jgi:hypothetical protein
MVAPVDVSHLFNVTGSFFSKSSLVVSQHPPIHASRRWSRTCLEIVADGVCGSRGSADGSWLRNGGYISGLSLASWHFLRVFLTKWILHLLFPRYQGTYKDI